MKIRPWKHQIFSFTESKTKMMGYPLKWLTRTVQKSTRFEENTVIRIVFVPLIFCLLIFGGIITLLIIDASEQYERLISVFGLCVFIFLGWIFSAHPGHVRWRHVIWGLLLQFVFAVVILRVDVGRDIFQCLGDKVSAFLSYTIAGSSFVYGWLASGQNLSVMIEPGITNYNITIVPDRLTDVFAFSILSVIFFFSFFINILYYFGVMQFVVIKLGWLLQISVGTTAAESMSASANIFLGQTEAPLLIKPYIGLMTKSELHAVMTGGFATIAGSVLAAYISFGIDASNLIAASVMAAPAALAFSKLFYPETEESKTKSDDIVLEKGKEANVLDAAAQGASNAVFLVMNIIANLIAFLAFVAFLNGIISWFAGLVGAPYITFEWLISKAFIPVAWLLGVHWSECEIVGQLIAIKSIVNEFAAFGRLAEFKKNGLISPRAEAIVTYALCGFANPGSIGAQIAALSSLSPSRASDLASIAFRAFIAGTTASFLNACIAGALTTAPGPDLPVENITSIFY
ncbi:sodium/nucleoside cotransporter 1-like isoform X2 [Artemia franciscana]|uniref:sodium/nucleoside cotransporter 1-like isoform X2 n=1 Tax=Artemia franciscana TaxID=6661 RepID=UPI0032DB8858